MNVLLLIMEAIVLILKLLGHLKAETLPILEAREKERLAQLLTHCEELKKVAAQYGVTPSEE